MQPNRRQFLVATGKALGGLALVHSSPTWAFATRHPRVDLIHRSIRAMGTAVRLSMPESAFTSRRADLALERIHTVDRLLTVHDPSSALMRMNDEARTWHGGTELVAVSRAALELGHRTEGALDVTVLPAMRHFGFVPGSVSDLGRIDFTRLEVSGQRARISESGFGADFGGIAKGYGVDQAVAALRSQGVDAALLDAGGDLYAMGRPDPDRRWTIGIRHPGRTDDLAARIAIEDEAVATSGTYLQQRVVDGQTVSHLIHPRTGQPVCHTVSSTILAPDAMTADALATATSVMEPPAAQALVAALPGVEGFWIHADGRHTLSRGMASRLELL